MINKIKDKLFNDKHLIEMLKGTSIALVFRLLGLFFGYLFILIISKFYGVDTVGLYVLSITILNIFTTIGLFGFDNSLVKFVANNKIYLLKEIYYKAVIISIPIGFILSLLLYIYSEYIAVKIFYNQELIVFFKITSLAIIPFILLKINSAIFRGLKKIKEYSFFETFIIFLLSLVLLAIFYFFHFNKEVVISSQILAIVISMILSYLLLKNFFNKDEKSISLSYKELITTSYPMLLTSSFGLLMNWADVIMLGMMRSESEVGMYSVAVKVAAIISIILVSINSIITPKFSELYSKNDFENLKNVVQKSTKLMFYMSMPILIIIVIFPNMILSIFGKEFINASLALQILVFGQFINVISGSVGNLLKMTGHEKVFQYIIFIALFINIILNYYLIPKMGIDGAAIATTTSLVFWNILSIIYVKIKLNIITLYLPFINNKEKIK